MERKVLGIIPARGGSKGIPKKNIANVGGKPLICYSIEAGLEAIKSGVLSNLIVSTDNNEIARISEKSGANVPFIRPSEFASDNAKSVDVIKHAILFFEEKNVLYDDVILLQPTTPLRNGKDIEEAYDIYIHGKYDSLISCYKEEYICDLVSYYKVGNDAVALDANHNKGVRRQELQDVYVRNGALYISSVPFIKRENLIFGGKLGMYVMPKERSVNIDTVYDLELADWMINKNE